MKSKKTAIEQDIENESVKILEQDTNSDLLKSIEILNNPKNIESNTILSNRQVIGLTMANYAGQVYEMEFYKHFVKSYPKYRISGDDGIGRKQVIQIAEAIQREKLANQEKLLDILGRR